MPHKIDMPDIVHCRQPKDFKRLIAGFDDKLAESFFKSSIGSILNARAELFDQLLIELWHRNRLAGQAISLNAVGGYGRNTLHPHSDIDICIIYEQQLNQQQETQIGAFLTQLWDLGVDIGHAVRSLPDSYQAAIEDVTIATNLLDIRTLCGPSSHADNVLAQLYRNHLWTSSTFFEHKIAEQQQRHNKANNTSLFLEPNLKVNPGGLRDVQTLIWIARKHFNASDALSLKQLGFLKNDEYSELIESHDFVCRVRWALHRVAQRAQERLLFDYQLDVAKFMGFGDNGSVAVEKMMRHLFRAMTRIRELNQMISELFKRQILLQGSSSSTTLNEQFSIVDGCIQANYDELFIDKTQVLNLFYQLAQHPELEGIAPETLRLLRQTRRRLLGELQDYQQCRQLFLALLTHRNGLGLPLSLMHRYGILASYFPEWQAIEGQMQFDMHNAYTVDEHAFRMVQHLDSFKQKADSKVLCNSLYRAFARKQVLIIAALCHELAPSQQQEQHKISAMHAEHFAQLHQLKKSDIALITWLVSNQDLLTQTIGSQDIHEPSVIHNLAKTIASESKLNALYCFTVADLMATNDELWNDWQQSLLDQLYFAVQSALKQGLENIFELRTVIRENKSDAQALLLQEAEVAPESLSQLWKQLPGTFFSANTADEIADYSRKMLQLNDDEVQISIEQSQVYGCSNLFVYLKDRPMLFVALFNTLSSLKIMVKDAQIIKTRDQHVLEIVKILDFNGEPISDDYRCRQIINKLRQVLLEGKTLPKLNPPKHLGAFDSAPNVEFLPSPQQNKALLRINALDNPHFIEKICRVFIDCQLTIHSAKISTIGECADNVFLVSNHDNSAIAQQEKDAIASQLIACIG